MIHLPLIAALAAAAPPIQVTPQAIDLGTVAFGTTTDATAWLINTTPEPVRVTGARPSCGCVIVEFEPIELGPHQAGQVHLVVKAPTVIGEPSNRSVRFTIEDAEPVKLDIAVQASHPLVDRVQRYAAARGAAADELLAADARLWIGSRQGAGHAIHSSGAWGDWDVFMRFEKFRVNGRRVLASATETNELSRLMGRPELAFAVTFELDEDDRIDAIVLVPKESPPAAVTASAAGQP